jgi:hypothetical protein
LLFERFESKDDFFRRCTNLPTQPAFGREAPESFPQSFRSDFGSLQLLQIGFDDLRVNIFVEFFREWRRTGESKTNENATNVQVSFGFFNQVDLCAALAIAVVEGNEVDLLSWRDPLKPR